MSDPFIGEIRLFGGNFTIAGWQQCDGSLLPISNFDVLFALIGTTYGGDGQNTFGVPDLRGRVPVGFGQGPGLQNYVIGQSGGAEAVNLTAAQLGGHSHAMNATGSGQADTPLNNLFASVTSSQSNSNAYDPTAANTALLPASILPTGGSQSHNNIQPTLAVTYLIAFEGIFPSRS